MYYIIIGIISLSSLILVMMSAFYMVLEVLGKGKNDNIGKTFKFAIYGLVLGALAGYLITSPPLSIEYLWFIVKLTFITYLIITLHELGHYLAARILKLPVSVFSVGIGPKLFTFTLSTTTFNFNLFPLKGFVKVDTEREKRLPLLYKCFFYLAGIFVNITSFFIGMTIYLFQQGQPIIESFVIALKKFLALIPMFYSILTQIQFSDIFTPEHDIENSIGIYISMANIAQEFWLGFALLSILIALFNIIPIPVLDGGRIVLAIMTSLLALVGTPAKYTERIFYTFLILGAIALYSPLVVNNVWSSSRDLGMALPEFLLWIGIGGTGLINLQIFIENQRSKKTS